MGQSDHRGSQQPPTRNRNNRMAGQPSNPSPEEKARNDSSTVEVFDQEGAGIAAKE
jgi:hypothetical protein